MKTIAQDAPRKTSYNADELKAVAEAAQKNIVAKFTPERAMILTTVQQLIMVREQFLYRVRYVARDLKDTADRLESEGRNPNGCGVIQSAPQIESYVGQINALTETLSLLLNNYPQ